MALFSCVLLKILVDGLDSVCASPEPPYVRTESNHRKVETHGILKTDISACVRSVFTNLKTF